MIKNIIFDMGNVLLKYDPWLVLNNLVDSMEDRQIIYQELFCGPEWVQGDCGIITNEERFEGVSKRVPMRLHDKLRECIDHWFEFLTPIEGAQAFIDYVRARGYRTYVLSNACSRFYTYFPWSYDVNGFDGIVVSSQEKMIKPDARIYSTLLERFGLNASECFFIDDVERNIDGARKLGISGYVFKEDYQNLIKYVDNGFAPC